MTPQEIRQFADDALTLRSLLIHARRDPSTTPDEREDYDALMRLCTGCLCLTDLLREKLKGPA
jgi:hypothetical protein